MDLETAQAIAARWRPDLAAAPGRLHTDGWNCWALEVGDWVVRIPRRPEIVDELLLDLGMEQRVLRGLATLGEAP